MGAPQWCTRDVFKTPPRSWSFRNQRSIGCVQCLLSGNLLWSTVSVRSTFMFEAKRWWEGVLPQRRISHLKTRGEWKDCDDEDGTGRSQVVSIDGSRGRSDIDGCSCPKIGSIVSKQPSTWIYWRYLDALASDIRDSDGLSERLQNQHDCPLLRPWLNCRIKAWRTHSTHLRQHNVKTDECMPQDLYWKVIIYY